MPQIYLEPATELTKWVGLAPDGTTASTALTAQVETTLFRYGPDKSSTRLTAAQGAKLHRFRWAIKPADLTDFDELRIYIRSNRIIEDTNPKSFFIELRVGNTSFPIDSQTNTWHRYLPVSERNVWELVRFSIVDMPLGLRSNVGMLELRIIDAETELSLFIDDISAVRDQMIVDIERALSTRMENILTISGKKVPVQRFGQAPPAGNVNVPTIGVSPYELQPRENRQNAVRARRDYMVSGYSIQPATQTWELVYRIDALAGDRDTEAMIQDFILDVLPASGELVVNSCPLPISFMPVSATLRGQSNPAALGAARMALFYKVTAWKELGTAERVRATERVFVSADFPSTA